jgi:alpha-tubulin suppressor-like RCC1 family protein
VQVLPPGATRHVSAGRRTYFAGALGFGDPFFGQFGLDPAVWNSQIGVPTALPAIHGTPVAGYETTFFLDGGRVFAAGYNASGELGNGTSDDPKLPVVAHFHFAPVQRRSHGGALEDLTDIRAVAGGTGFAVALRRDGTVWTWGANGFGQLGDGTQNGRPFALPVRHADGHLLEDIVEISVTTGRFYSDSPVPAHVLARSADGRVWGWGENRDGELANGRYWQPTHPGEAFDAVSTVLPEPYPVLARTRHGHVLDRVTGIAAGGDHSLALREDGPVWSWGYNGTGQLGNGVALDDRGVGHAAPVADTPFGGGGVERVFAGPAESFAVDRNGGVWSWGFNHYGGLCQGPVASLDGRDPATWVLRPSPAITSAQGTQLKLR